MARPRSKTDEEIFAGLRRAMLKRGPDKLSLTDVAREVGLTPPALVQRFGSRRELLLAFVRNFYGRLATDFERARSRHDSSLGVLIGFLCELAGSVRTPEELANSVAFLYVDLTDPDFYRAYLDWSKDVLGKLELVLREAERRGEVEPLDAARWARAVWTTYSGALLTWATFREGEIGAWIRESLETLLDPVRRS